MITNYNGTGVSESITDIYKAFVEFYLYEQSPHPKKFIWEKAKREFKKLKKATKNG